MKLKLVLNISLIAMTMLVSCEKFLEIDPPNDKLPAQSVFSDSLSASSAVAGIYSTFVSGNSGFLGTHMIWAALCSDELDYTGSELRRSQYYHNDVESDNGYLGVLWSNPYSCIYQVNNLIDGVQAASAISSSAKKILIAEAKFIRAFMFFYLVNYFGDVPLTVNSDYRVNERMPRTPVQIVYEQMVADLEEAERELPAAYLTAERVRPNKWAATAFLARLHLYLGNWEEAEKKASLVIGQGSYLPLPEAQNVFLKESRETIWQLFPAPFIPTYSTYDAFNYVPPSLTNAAIPTYELPNSLLNSFDEKDERKKMWVGVKTIGNRSYYYPYKYKVRTGASTAPLVEYTVVFRLSEQFLIRAEARGHLSKVDGGISDLNEIRRRAGLEDLPNTIDEAQLIEAVENERRHELFCEWGHRWLDLKRTRMSDAVLKTIKGVHWQSTDVYWPIPLAEMLANPSLIQNDGY